MAAETEYVVSIKVQGTEGLANKLGALETAGYGVASGAKAGEAGIVGMTRSVGSLYQMTAGSAIVLGLGKAIMTVTRAAMDAERASIELEHSIRMKGAAAGVTAAELESLASSLQVTTMFEDDAIKRAQAVLLQFDAIDGSNIEKVTRLTLDFAQATGSDLTSAARQLGRALTEPGEGMRALAQVGVTAKEEMISFDAVLTALNEKLSGRAVAAANSAEGSFAKLKNTLGDLAEVAGGPVANALSGVANQLTQGFLGLQSLFTGDWKAFRDALGPEQQKVFDRYFVTADKGEKILARVNQRFSEGAKGAKSMEEALRLSGDALDEQRKRAEEAADEQDRFAESLRAVLDELYPVEKASREYSSDAAFLARAFESGKIGATDYASALAILLGRLDAIRNASSAIETFDLSDFWKKQLGGVGFLDEPQIIKLTQPLQEGITSAFDAAGQDFLQSWGDAFGATVYAAFNGGDVVEAFVETLKRGLASTLAQLFSDLAVAFGKEIAAQTAANATVNGGGGMGGLGGWGKVASNPWTWVAAAAVAVLAISNSHRKKQEARRYDEEAQFTFNQYTGFDTGANGRGTKSRAAILAGISDFWSSIQDSTGAMLTGMSSMIVKIRHDQKAFRVEMNGAVIGTFKDMKEAMIAGIKAQFASAEFGNAIDPAIRQLVEGFRGTDPEELTEGVRWLQSLIDAGSGLSDLGREIRGFTSYLEQSYQRMLEMGVSAADARRISGDLANRNFTDWRRQLTGGSESEADQRKRLEADRQLYNAELALYKSRLMIRKAEIQVELSGTQARGGIVRAQGKIWEAEIGMGRDYIQARGQLAAEQAKILQAELDAINAVLGSLPKELGIGEVKLPKLGGGGGFGGFSVRESLIDRWKRAMEDLIAAVKDAKFSEATTGLTNREQLIAAASDYRSLFARAQGGDVTAAEGLDEAYRLLLSLAKDYSGGGSGLGFLGFGDSFRQLFDLVSGQVEGLANGPKPAKLLDGLQKTASDQLRSSQMHRQENRDDLQKLATRINVLESVSRDQLDELRRANQMTRLRAA